jgi:GGDEF domain-containing protein
VADEEILRRIDKRLARGDELMAEVRAEHELNRRAYTEQLALTRTVVQRNAEAFAGLMTAIDRFRERIDAFGDRIDAFGDTLVLQVEILTRCLDRLDEREPPQG